MKNIFKILFVAIVTSLVWSCEKDEDLAVASVIAKSKLEVSKDNVVLLQLEDDNEAVEFTYTNTEYTASVVPTYQLEFALADTNFSNSKAVIVDSNKKVFTVKDLNNLVAEIATPEVATKFDVRINSILGKNVENSAPISFTVTTYVPNPDNVYPKIYVPGGYAGTSGYKSWSPTNWESPALFSPNKDDKFFGFVYMNFASAGDAQFKFTYAEEGWGNNKGDVANPNTYSSLKADGENIAIPSGVGTYYMTVDWAKNSYSIKKMDMGIIGEATPQGWDSDVKLTFNQTTHKFETTMALTGGKVFKFRNDSSWGVKLQPQSSDVEITAGKEYPIYNSAEGTVNGDPNFKVAESGTYKIEVDLHNSANYNIKITKQ